jgi:hypothetical protein
MLALTLAGCGSRAGQSKPQAELPGHLPVARQPRSSGAPGASVKFLEPTAGSEQDTRFTARVAVRRFVLQRAPAGANPVTGHGHLHFILDGGRYDQPQFSGANGRAALHLAVNGYYSPATMPTITYEHIPAGRHTLEVTLVKRNEAATGVAAIVKFIVR